MLARGFWLYVWEIVTENGRTILYVGRTGDSSSPKAQSPFTRLSQHLGSNDNSNTLRKNLFKHGIDANTCTSFEMIAYGPLLTEEKNWDAHCQSRDIMAALEKALAADLSECGYFVLNVVNCKVAVDLRFRNTVLSAFSVRFKELAALLPAAELRGAQCDSSS